MNEKSRMAKLLICAALVLTIVAGSATASLVADRGAEADAATRKKAKPKPKAKPKSKAKKRCTTKKVKGKKKRVCKKAKRKTPAKPKAQPAPNTQTTPPAAPAPPADQLRRDDAGFAAYLTGIRLYRVYEVRTGNNTATHEEFYNFCTASTLYHHFESLSYIYKSRGPWRVLEGNISPDTTKGQGSIEFVQEEANFAEERGKTQSPITITWSGGDTATVSHPEITPPHEFSRNPGFGTACPAP